MGLFKKDYLERRIYFFKCENCGKDKRRTFFKEKAEESLCGTCRRNKVDPNQMALLKKEVMK